MSESKDRKRLRLMPEVLPAPVVQPAETSPRQRAVANMQRLLALAAAGAALQAGCSKDAGPPDRPADPASTSATATATSAVVAPALTTATPIPTPIGVATTVPTALATVAPTSTSLIAAPHPSATVKPSATATAVRPQPGFGVVDPMPRPAHVPVQKK